MPVATTGMRNNRVRSNTTVYKSNALEFVSNNFTIKLFEQYTLLQYTYGVNPARPWTVNYILEMIRDKWFGIEH